MQKQFVVLKFGGSSVGEANHWLTITNQVKQQLNNQTRPLLVLSALKNVSNLLEALLHQAIAGVYQQPIEHLRELHIGFSAQLGLDLTNQLSSLFEDLCSDCQTIFNQGVISPQLHASIVATGELLSTTIGSHYLRAMGIETIWLDARQLLTADSIEDKWHHFTGASCRYHQQPQLIEKVTGKPLSDNCVYITQGFIASDHEDNTVLLGREGSDTSAAYLGAILQAKEIQIWTDVDGVFSANPREINNARQLPFLSYQHAHLMARFGAKVLHPRALQPAEKNAIPLTVRCTSNPIHMGTRITKDSEPSKKVKAVVYEPSVEYINISNLNSDKDFTDIIKRLSSRGFDLLLSQHEMSTAELVLSYNNSDQAKPTPQQLTQLLPAFSFKVLTNCALISVIGESDKHTWIEQSCLIARKIAGDSFIGSFQADANNRVSLLIQNYHYLELSRCLHEHLIDD